MEHHIEHLLCSSEISLPMQNISHCFSTCYVSIMAIGEVFISEMLVCINLFKLEFLGSIYNVKLDQF